jgi:hypothetical protein
LEWAYNTHISRKQPIIRSKQAEFLPFFRVVGVNKDFKNLSWCSNTNNRAASAPPFRINLLSSGKSSSTIHSALVFPGLLSRLLVCWNSFDPKASFESQRAAAAFLCSWVCNFNAHIEVFIYHDIYCRRHQSESKFKVLRVLEIKPKLERRGGCEGTFIVANGNQAARGAVF